MKTENAIKLGIAIQWLLILGITASNDPTPRIMLFIMLLIFNYATRTTGKKHFSKSMAEWKAKTHNQYQRKFELEREQERAEAEKPKEPEQLELKI